MSWFEIYMWTRLDALNGFCQLVTVLSGLVIFGGIICTIATKVRLIETEMDLESEPGYRSYIRYNNDAKKYYEMSKNGLKASIIVFSVFIFLYLFIPTKEEVAMIYVVPEITNSEIAKSVPDDMLDIYKLGIKELKEIIQDRKGEKPAPEKE